MYGQIILPVHIAPRPRGDAGGAGSGGGGVTSRRGARGGRHRDGGRGELPGNCGDAEISHLEHTFIRTLCTWIFI